MSTITESPYDLYANYSTAAAYASPASTSTLATTSASENNSFTDLLVAESEAAGIDDVDDSAGADVDTGNTDDTTEEGSGNDSSSGTNTDNSTNSNYNRPSTNVENTASDELSFTDMLQLMLLQFQNQTIDDTASTTDMMNQLTQMTTMQAMTSMEDSITEMTATNAMLYNAQLVGQEVTVGYYDAEGNFVEETGIVAASGYYDGVPVVFFEGQTSFHTVSSIMAIGKLPETEATPDEDSGSDDGTTDGAGDAAGSGGTGSTEDTEGSDGTNGSDTTVGDSADTGAEDNSDSTDTITNYNFANSFVDYSNMTPEELLEASSNALG